VETEVGENLSYFSFPPSPRSHSGSSSWFSSFDGTSSDYFGSYRTTWDNPNSEKEDGLSFDMPLNISSEFEFNPYFQPHHEIHLQNSQEGITNSGTNPFFSSLSLSSKDFFEAQNQSNHSLWEAEDPNKTGAQQQQGQTEGGQMETETETEREGGLGPSHIQETLPGPPWDSSRWEWSKEEDKAILLYAMKYGASTDSWQELVRSNNFGGKPWQALENRHEHLIYLFQSNTL
jgi:hypothetical protein